MQGTWVQSLVQEESTCHRVTKPVHHNYWVHALESTWISNTRPMCSSYWSPCAKAADIKRWQEYTEELYKKELHDSDNHNGVIADTHLEPDILECEVKWALGSITMNKASGGDGIPVELFQILKDDAVKVLHSICQQIWKTAVATGLANPKERQYQRLLKLSHNCTHLTC